MKLLSKILKQKNTTNISKLKIEINKITLEFKNILNSINDNFESKDVRNNILIEIEKLEKDISILFEKELENTISTLNLINKEIFN